ncbi:ABC transporter ATP-binding protein [Alcaligenaceae bacterium]|nr:ABC transporter ATP-binding protein [Alcaligenaceae bacterium]
MSAETTVLELDELVTEFRIGGAWHAAVRKVSFSVARNETLAVVGESGSGKSVTALSIMRLLPASGARLGSGHVRFEGRDLTCLPEKAMAAIRGNEIAMIFQEPMTSLNPTMTVGDQIAEAVRLHRRVSWSEARKVALDVLEEVKIPAAARRFNDYPHQFSGGMRQRVMIAMALACRPKLLLADEPTTALDVTIQAQILTLLDDLKKAYGMSVVFITHNLGVVAQIADRVAVMYGGEIVELADAAALFAQPAHPYTEALLKAMPRVDTDTESLEAIPGNVPPITSIPRGCTFAARCPLREARCETEHPELSLLPGGRQQVRCHVRARQAGVHT